MLLAALAAAGEAVQKAASGIDLTAILQSYAVQFGFLFVLLVCVASKRWFVPLWTLTQAEERHTREIASRDKTIADQAQQLQKLQALTAEQLIPALTRATEVGAKYNEELARRRWAGEPQ